MLGLNNARINQLEAENRTLRVELDAGGERGCSVEFNERTRGTWMKQRDCNL